MLSYFSVLEIISNISVLISSSIVEKRKCAITFSKLIPFGVVATNIHNLISKPKQYQLAEK